MSLATEDIQTLPGPILVIGAGGFIGSNLVRRLSTVRDDVYAATHQPHIPWRLIGVDPNRIVYADVTRAWDIQQLFARRHFQTIFYLAAYGGYSRQTDIESIYETNILGLVNVLQEAKLHGFSAFVHAGSSSEYGTNCEAPAEDATLEPNSHYAVAKVSASFLVRYAANKDQLPIINLRFYSVYGPWEEPDRLIPRVIQAGLAGRFPPFVDPKISRDFVYVDDAVDALILGASRGVFKAPGSSINIATGIATTIEQVAAEAKALFQLKGEPAWTSMPNRLWDLEKWYGNPALASTLLDWKAQTLFRDGLRRTLEWSRNRGMLPEPQPHVRWTGTLRLSAVIACYKDNQAIPIMKQRLTDVFQKLQVDYEIIFVNDGSPDDTHEVLAELCAQDGHVIEIQHSRNFGSQNAFLSGMAIATGDAVILLDGDLQDPPELIADFFQRWKEGYDVVYGRRVKREANPLLNVCFKLFYRLLNRIAYVTIPVDAGDFSLIDRRVLNELLALPETDQFLRGLRAWVGFRQTHIDYERPERRFGASTNNWFRNIGWARKGIFSFSFVPLDLLFFGGIGLTGLSVLALLVQVAYRLVHPDIPHGITTLIVLILFFGGLQLTGMSILGEYLGKTLEESKHRPKYIRRSIRIGKRLYDNPHDVQELIQSRFIASR